MKGASAYVRRLETDIQGDLNVISEQSSAYQKSSGTNFSARVQVSFGTAWGANGSFGSNKGSSTRADVSEQSGFFVGDGGYHVKANKLNLTGGALLSTAAKEQNRLDVKDFSFSDIQNYAHAKAESLMLMGGFSVGRDQTSAEDKALNKKYREGRTNADGSEATFKQANLNQQNASPLKFGLSDGDVHSSDLYAVAKLGLVNGLGNAKEAKNHTSVTKAVISEGVFNIESESGKAAMENVTKMNGDRLNIADSLGKNDTMLTGEKLSSPSNPSLPNADLETLMKKAEITTEFNKALLKVAASETDHAYHKMFVSEHRKMDHVIENGSPVDDPERLAALNDAALKDAKKEGITGEKEIAQHIEKYSEKAKDKGYNIYQLYELSDEQRKQIQPVTYTNPKTGKQETRYFTAFNGIFNDRHAAAKFAVQEYIAKTNPENGKIDKKIYENIYFVHHPKATTPSISEVFKAAYHNLTNPRNRVNVYTLPTENTDTVAELLIAGYQKWFKSRDNSVRQAENLLKDYGNQGLFVGSHSRGTLTVSNALQRLDTKGNADSAILSATEMKMVGAAANVTRADNILNRLQGRGETRQSSEGSILVENSKHDAIGSWWAIGGNPYTTETNTHNKNTLKTLKDIFGDDSSAHNCYGLGQRQCIKDGYRKEGDLIMYPEKTIFDLNKEKLK